MKTEHKYAQVLRWIADGEEIQWQRSSGEWVNQDSDCALKEVICKDWHPERYRLKPRTITVNGREVPEPVMQPLPTGSKYFVPCFETEELYRSVSWSGFDVGLLRLERGLVHLTKEAAIAHAKAMLNID